MKEKLLKFSNPRNKNWWLFTGALVIFVLAVVLFTMTEEKDADSLQELSLIHISLIRWMQPLSRSSIRKPTKLCTK